MLNFYNNFNIFRLDFDFNNFDIVCILRKFFHFVIINMKKNRIWKFCIVNEEFLGILLIKNLLKVFYGNNYSRKQYIKTNIVQKKTYLTAKVELNEQLVFTKEMVKHPTCHVIDEKKNIVRVTNYTHSEYTRGVKNYDTGAESNKIEGKNVQIVKKTVIIDFNDKNRVREYYNIMKVCKETKVTENEIQLKNAINKVVFNGLKEDKIEEKSQFMERLKDLMQKSGINIDKNIDD